MMTIQRYILQTIVVSSLLAVVGQELAIAQKHEAQTVDNPRGVFLKQKVKVGEPVEYILTFRHSAEMEVLFPDSTYDFTPFEWVGQTYFPTRTDSTGSTDSVVYTLMTFELDSIQKLSIPVWEVTGTEEDDKKSIFPLEDRVILQPTIVAQPDSVELITNTSFLPVLKQFNYPYLLVGVGIFLILSLIAIIFFGKPIRKAYQLRKMKKEYERFAKEFDHMIDSQLEAAQVEHAMARWKNYTSKMVDLPLYSYTTKEIAIALPDSGLKDNLSKMDRVLYAGMLGNDLPEVLRYLRNYAFEAYQQKVKEVRNA